MLNNITTKFSKQKTKPTNIITKNTNFLTNIILLMTSGGKRLCLLKLIKGFALNDPIRGVNPP
jgi:hypothetical protein